MTSQARRPFGRDIAEQQPESEQQHQTGGSEFQAAHDQHAAAVAHRAQPLGHAARRHRNQRDRGDRDGRWQDGKDNFNREATPQAWDVIDLLSELSTEKGCSVSQLALAWCAAQPDVTAPIIGPRTFEQVEDNLGAVDVRLERADLERIDALVPPKAFAVRYYDEAAGLDQRTHTHRSAV